MPKTTIENHRDDARGGAEAAAQSQRHPRTARSPASPLIVTTRRAFWAQCLQPRGFDPSTEQTLGASSVTSWATREP